MANEIPLAVGDEVELVEGAPIPPHHAAAPGTRGRVVVIDEPDEGEASLWVAIVLPGRVLPVRLHQRWLRRVEP